MAKKKALLERQIRWIAKGLADPRRHEILRQIGASEDTAFGTDIRECQPVTAATLCHHYRRHSVPPSPPPLCATITAATLSHHRKELETAGLIKITREGKFARLELQRDVLKGYLAHLKKIQSKTLYWPDSTKRETPLGERFCQGFKSME
ncbi:MAG: ArsR/SmtB family transcription factor [Acidobacteriaceae bacterium]